MTRLARRTEAVIEGDHGSVQREGKRGGLEAVGAQLAAVLAGIAALAEALDLAREGVEEGKSSVLAGATLRELPALLLGTETDGSLEEAGEVGEAGADAEVGGAGLDGVHLVLAASAEEAHAALAREAARRHRHAGARVVAGALGLVHQHLAVRALVALLADAAAVPAAHADEHAAVEALQGGAVRGQLGGAHGLLHLLVGAAADRLLARSRDVAHVRQRRLALAHCNQTQSTSSREVC